MLGLLEKIQFVLSGLVVLGAVTLYVIWPPEYNDPGVLRANTIKKVSAPAPSPRKASAGPTARPPAPEVSPEDKAILDRLAKEQNVRGIAGKSLQRELHEVDAKTFDYVKREANWQPELDKAHSRLLPGADGRQTRVQIFNIDESSILKSKFHFQDNDIIEFIDGQAIDFGGSSRMDHIQTWKRLRDKLGTGGAVPLTITRGGQPIQIELKLK